MTEDASSPSLVQVAFPAGDPPLPGVALYRIPCWRPGCQESWADGQPMRRVVLHVSKGRVLGFRALCHGEEDRAPFLADIAAWINDQTARMAA